MLEFGHCHVPSWRIFASTIVGFLLGSAAAIISIADDHSINGRLLSRESRHAATPNLVVYNQRGYHQPLQSRLQLSAKGDGSDINTKLASSIEIAGELLEDAIDKNSSAAIKILNIANELRTTSGNNNTVVEKYYNEILSTGPDSKKKRNIPFRFTPLIFTRYSKRARLASLRRTISKTTSPTPVSASASASSSSTADSIGAGRRRAFVSLLRDISKYDDQKNDDDDAIKVTSSIIAVLERKARRMSNAKLASIEELKSRIPDGLETPKYKVISSSSEGDDNEEAEFKLNGRSSSNVEIREYLPYSVCAVSMNNQVRPYEQYNKTDAKIQMPQMSGASSFGQLAGYLFGKNDKSKPMKMTTPVFTTKTKATTPAPEGDGYANVTKQMEFVLPSEYWDINKLNKDAPKPLPGSGVTLQQRDTEYRAVLMFSGFATTKEVQKRSKELLSTIEKSLNAIESNKNNWEIAPSEADDGDENSNIAIAQYNDPFTVPWRRLNEVSIKLTRKK